MLDHAGLTHAGLAAEQHRATLPIGGLRVPAEQQRHLGFTLEQPAHRNSPSSHPRG